MELIGPRFRDHVHHAACGAPKFRRGSGCNHLKFLHSIERDIDSGALSANLLAKKAVIVIAAIQADVVVDSALSSEIDFVAIRTLDDAYARSKRQQIFELSS